jgi:hypothetical protein
MLPMIKRPEKPIYIFCVRPTKNFLCCNIYIWEHGKHGNGVEPRISFIVLPVLSHRTKRQACQSQFIILYCLFGDSGNFLMFLLLFFHIYYSVFLYLAIYIEHALVCFHCSIVSPSLFWLAWFWYWGVNIEIFTLMIRKKETVLEVWIKKTHLDLHNEGFSDR